MAQNDLVLVALAGESLADLLANVNTEPGREHIVEQTLKGRPTYRESRGCTEEEQADFLEYVGLMTDLIKEQEGEINE